ncbi:MAG: FHA domain-containing protein [Bacteriovoracaceae bacterium]
MKLSVYKNSLLLQSYDFSNNENGNVDTGINIFIGRSKDCHVVLDDKQISRQHAKIIFTDNGWTLEKISPLGNLLVNGSPVENKCVLNSSDSIVLGSFSISVELSESEQNINSKPAPINTPEVTAAKVEESEKPEEAQTTEEVASPADQPEQPLEENGFSSSNEVENVETPSEETPAEEVASGEDNGENESSTRIFSSFMEFELKLEGPHAPYDIYKITQPEIYIGRDPTRSQIVIRDTEVSGRHALLRKGALSCKLMDLDSSNGTILNGKRINEADLNHGDEFQIGTTKFTFLIKSEMLKDEEESLMPVEQNQEIEVTEEVEEEIEEGLDLGEDNLVTADSGSGGNFGGDETDAKPAGKKSLIASLLSKDALKDPEKRKKLIIGLVVIIGAWALLSEDDTSNKKPTENKSKVEKSNRLNVDSGEKQPKAPPVEGSPAKVVQLTKEQKEFVESSYVLAKKLFNQGKYAETIFEIDKVFAITPDYKESKQIYILAKQGLAKLEEMEKKKQEEIDRKIRQEKVVGLLEKVKVAVKNREKIVAEGLFSQIMQLDPENADVPQLKLELEAWVKEQDKIALEKAEKESARKKMVDGMQEGKNLFLRKEWFKAVSALELYLKEKNLDEDLIKEATKMVEESRANLKATVDPILEKARSLKEGQDFKGAYQAYQEILKIQPGNRESLDEINSIKDVLELRARKVYREAIVSESLSLFDDAKEKLQEVQQISPNDSDYYKKATDKLRDYLQ